MVSDILLVNKPKGITSFEVIRRLRKKINIKKMGHAGTLDPLATGLMIIGVGEGTKKLKEYVGLNKTYEAEIILGLRTDTSDREGKVIEACVVKNVDEEKIKNTLQSMVGVLRLPVSAYSATKQGGEAVYKKVRSGKPFVQPIRDMEVIRVVFCSSEEKNEHVHVRVVFEVGSGTYIRSLAEELGKRLGYPAILGSLRRTQVGDMRVEDAQAIECFDNIHEEQ